MMTMFLTYMFLPVLLVPIYMAICLVLSPIAIAFSLIGKLYKGLRHKKTLISDIETHKPNDRSFSKRDDLVLAIRYMMEGGDDKKLK